jgi:VanZ family protein
LKYYFPAFAWAVFILVVSTKVGLQINTDFWDFISLDKLAHAFVYGILAYLLLWGVSGNGRRITNRTTSLVFLAGASYGLLLEYVQFAFFPGRYFEWGDELANVIGTLLGIFFFKHIKLF